MAPNGVNGMHYDETVELWRHPHPEKSEFHAFQQHVAKKHGVPTTSYNDLWQWSVDHPGPFWEEVYNYTGIRAHKSYNSVSGVWLEAACRCVLTRATGPGRVLAHVP
jgi:acetoacetyl-CoA synthetase